MKKFEVSGTVSVPCWTLVEAESPEQALEIAAKRRLASMTSYPFSDDIEWSFHMDAKGEPKPNEAREVDE